MYLLAWIVIGAVIGWGAGRVFQGNGFGPLMDTLLGIGGGIVGGFAMSSAGLGGYGGTIITTLVGMVGAVLLTVLAAYINGRKDFRTAALSASGPETCRDLAIRPSEARARSHVENHESANGSNFKFLGIRERL
jgi:uncharacterized membrane protein YeaQ/YmgE (transglycosylase-associated protein family)